MYELSTIRKSVVYNCTYIVHVTVLPLLLHVGVFSSVYGLLHSEAVNVQNHHTGIWNTYYALNTCT